MKTIASVFLALALAVCLAPGHAAEDKKLQIVTTSTDIQDLVRTVGGRHVQVESIAAPNQDPHSIEIKPFQIERLKKADLVFRIGLDHEPWLSRIKMKKKVVDVSLGVQLLQAETPRLRVERRAHSHAFGNPHYWLDPENAKPITASIVEALTKLNPVHKAEYEKNRTAFIEKLDTRLQAWKSALAPYKGTKVVVMHDSWPYFAARFGLSIVAAAEPTPGVPPSPSELAKLFDRMRQHKVQLLIADPSSNPALVKQVSEKGMAKEVMLLPSVGAAPEASDYISLFEVNVQRLVSAMK